MAAVASPAAGGVAEAKKALRRRVRDTRSALDAGDLAQAARGLRDVLLVAPEVAGAGRVAAYVSVGREPGTGPLIEELSDRGVEVLLPLLQNDGDLDWALYEGPRALARVARGLLEPTGEQLGLDAVASCDAVLVPGLAVDRGGSRLGRGGGSSTGLSPASAPAPSPASCSTTARCSTFRFPGLHTTSASRPLPRRLRFTACAVFSRNATEIADGQTYAQLPQDDPNRQTVMDAAFLQASLFTSVVAFGVAVMAAGLGLALIFVGLALRSLARRAPVGQPSELEAEI